jgi:hypothetical protein
VRVCALVCVAAAVVVARPAVAAMTIEYRDGRGRTMTFRQDGSRIRVEVPPAKDDPDDGLTSIVDLKTNERIIVYDEVRAYFDVSKVLARARAAVEQVSKGQQPARPRQGDRITYRALGETRTKNGFACEMHERVAGGRVEAQVCFALWGGAIGDKGDFAWFDEFMERMVSDIAGKKALRAMSMSHARDKAPGLAIWTSSIEKDGSTEVTEIVKVSREPLPASMFHLPANYVEMDRPLTASERSPAPAPDYSKGPVLETAARPAGPQLSGGAAILLMVIFGFVLLIDSALLHFAASIAIDGARFMQALVATLSLWVVLGIIRIFGLPGVLDVAVGALATFAAVKISYGASVPRTLWLFVVSGLLNGMLAFLGKIFT